MEDDEGNRNDTGIGKAADVEKVLENLEHGIFEVYEFVGGQSDVWEKFFKIRNSETKEHVGFAQCIECKSLLSFKKHSGTSHLSRHECRKGKTGKSDEIAKYRRLPKNKIDSTRSLITNNTIKLCARDFVSYESICASANFLDWAQSFVALGYKHGNIKLQDVFPNCSRVHREITNFKEEKMRVFYEDFRSSLKNEWCSATFEVRSYGNDKEVVIMSIQYFEKDLKGLKKKVFFSIILDKGFTSHDFLLKLVKQFNVFGGDKKDLEKLKIVTTDEKVFSEALVFPFIRKDCVADKITSILNEGFQESNIVSQSQDVVNFINSNEKYNIILSVEDGTWKSKVDMIRSICENYNDIINALEKENHKNPIEFNKRKAEEILSFLEPFIEALDDLLASSYPTANKVLLWWKVFHDHMNNRENCSLELKQIIANTRVSFDVNFYPTLDNKIDCFLDPRYKSLKMLSEIERTNVITDVRNMLKELEDDEVEEVYVHDIPGSKSSRFANFEADKSKKQKQNKKNRFESYESNNADLEDNDEVNIYLKLPAMKFETEFDIIGKFWKLKKKTLPKLFKLASTRLHVPACCGIAGLKILTSNENLKEADLNDYIFLRDNV